MTGVRNNNRILLFKTTKTISNIIIYKILSFKQCHWLIDGTFKLSLQLFTQILTIHAIKFNTVLSLVFMLLPNKINNSYDRVAKELLNINKNYNQ